MQQFHLPTAHGLLVQGVQPGTGAAKAGLHGSTSQVTVQGDTWPLGGDIIVAADGVPVSSIAALRDAVAAKQPGDTMTAQDHPRHEDDDHRRQAWTAACLSPGIAVQRWPLSPKRGLLPPEGLVASVAGGSVTEPGPRPPARGSGFLLAHPVKRGVRADVGSGRRMALPCGMLIDDRAFAEAGPGSRRWEGDPRFAHRRSSASGSTGGDGYNGSRPVDLGRTPPGTHIDAPLHFLRRRRDRGSIPLETLVGPWPRRRRHRGAPDRSTPRRSRASSCRRVADRLLFKTQTARSGSATASRPTTRPSPATAPRRSLALGVRLAGIDYLTIGDEDAHHVLLGAGVVPLEGLDLREVEPGPYTLFCLPLKVAGTEGAPARALSSGSEPDGGAADRARPRSPGGRRARGGGGALDRRGRGRPRRLVVRPHRSVPVPGARVHLRRGLHDGGAPDPRLAAAGRPEPAAPRAAREGGRPQPAHRRLRDRLRAERVVLRVGGGGAPSTVCAPGSIESRWRSGPRRSR